jgi:hypothetical protein
MALMVGVLLSLRGRIIMARLLEEEFASGGEQAFPSRYYLEFIPISSSVR